jgi:hypothetical protein
MALTYDNRIDLYDRSTKKIIDMVMCSFEKTALLNIKYIGNNLIIARGMLNLYLFNV